MQQPSRRSWPAPSDPAAAADFAGRLALALNALPRTPKNVLAEPGALAAFEAIGGNSPFLADLALREAALVPALLAGGADAVMASILDELTALDAGAPKGVVASALRQAKRQGALAIAWADLGGAWSLEQITSALSRLAEAALSRAVEHLLLHWSERGRISRRDRAAPARGCGLAVIGMGKLGAGELNYSSDVDLVLLYDPAAHDAGFRPELASTFSRLARDLVALMAARDADGYVFRMDLRLRPDPGVTAPAVSLAAALTYYESLAQTWERAALVKARPVAGDLALGARFLDLVSPFIWRRHLDFAAIGDIHAMKARIDRQHRGRPSALGTSPGRRVAELLGHDLKLGAGGIREIEFIAQALQLVWGGRDPSLRQRGTLPALRNLQLAGHLAPSDATSLAAAYRTLRTAEHRLQMVADRQTHALPAEPRGFARFAVFMGEPDGEALAALLLPAIISTEAAWRALLPRPASGNAVAVATILTADHLRSIGFRRPDDAASTIEAWRAGGVRALRLERARTLFDRLLPILVPALGAQREPDVALARLGRLLERLPAGVPTFSLLAQNPPLLRRIADVLGASASLAETLAASPAALEGLLARAEIDPAPRRTLERELSGRRDGDAPEVAIDVARRFQRGEAFRLALAELDGRVGIDAVGRARTALADAVITSLASRVLASQAQRHGVVRGGTFAVLALGKAGSRAMMAGSDLDLMLIYDHPVGTDGSRGGERRTLPSGQYYGRAAQSLIAAITAPGLDGPLYSCDMRLRPSGRSGPVAVSLAAFERYHQEMAWTWERMALTRARIVVAPASLRPRLADAIATALDVATDDEAARRDAALMRVRLERDRPPTGAFDVKRRPGGLIEVEFIAQVLQLGPAMRGRRSTATAPALLRLAAAGRLPRNEAQALAAADRFWRSLQSTLRLLHGPEPPAGSLPEATREALAGAVGLQDHGHELEARMEACATLVRSAFLRHVGALPGALLGAGRGEGGRT